MAAEDAGLIFESSEARLQPSSCCSCASCVPSKLAVGILLSCPTRGALPGCRSHFLFQQDGPQGSMQRRGARIFSRLLLRHFQDDVLRGVYAYGFERSGSARSTCSACLLVVSRLHRAPIASLCAGHQRCSREPFAQCCKERPSILPAQWRVELLNRPRCHRPISERHRLATEGWHRSLRHKKRKAQEKHRCFAWERCRAWIS